MTEVITVEAVSDKFKNQYNSGSVLAGGKWMQVSSKLNLDDFQKDSQVTVETKTNDKGYTSIVKLVEKQPVQTVEHNEKPSVETYGSNVNGTSSTVTDPVYFVRNGYGKPMSQYEIDLDRRISRAGIIQAALACPAVAGLPYTTVQDIAENVRQLAREMIDFVDEQSK